MSPTPHGKHGSFQVRCSNPTCTGSTSAATAERASFLWNRMTDPERDTTVESLAYFLGEPEPAKSLEKQEPREIIVA